MIKVFALHQGIQLICGKISTQVKRHNCSTSHDLYCTYSRAISRFTFAYSTAPFIIILQTNHCMQDPNSQHLRVQSPVAFYTHKKLQQLFCNASHLDMITSRLLNYYDIENINRINTISFFAV